MNKNMRGFTLIELVVVILILGILSATALPKFIDLSTDAGNAAAAGVAGSIASGTAINFAAKKAGHTPNTTLNDTNANTCTPAVLQTFVTGVTLTATDPAPDNNSFTVSGGTGSCVSNDGGTITCNIKAKNGSAQPAIVTCAN